MLAEEAPTEPQLTLGQLETESKSRRFGIPALLVGIVVLVAFVDGVLCKLNTAQHKNAVVENDPDLEEKR